MRAFRLRLAVVSDRASRVSVAGSFQRLRALVIEYAQVDARNAFLWTPVTFGAGAALYFSLSTEPAVWAAPVIAALAVAAMRVFPSFRLLLTGVMLAAAGATIADLRTDWLNGPQIERELSPRVVEGVLISIGESGSNRRLVIAPHRIGNLEAAQLPKRIRLNWRGGSFDAAPGETISLRAGVSPPPPPVAPGAFDFARYLYFQRIGGVGYAVSQPVVIRHEAPTFIQSVRANLETVRLSIFRRIVAAAPGDGGAITAAIVTGKRDAISDEAEAALRDAGLAHLLAISGLHMGLATGLIYFFVRAALALSERLALRVNIKKGAATCALLSGFAYLLLSGGGWSARRAFIMTAIIFIAVLIDRRAISLRNVAIAAMLILAVTPEAVTQPGFQMSFAAAVALIAFFEVFAARRTSLGEFDRTVWARGRRYAVGLAATDTIAALATAPYALYHFNRVALYSLPANLAAMPIMGFWIMPFAIGGLLLAPFGWDGLAWRAAAEGMEVILSVARWASTQPGAVRLTIQWPPSALAAATMGGLWICLMKAPWRWAGFACFLLSWALVAASPRPDVFFARKGDNAGVMIATETGRDIAVFDRRKSRFDAEGWREFIGADPDRSERPALRDVSECDSAGCVIEVENKILAISANPNGLAEDCARADLVIALYPAPRALERRCAAMLINRRDAWDHGAHAIELAPSGEINVRTVADRRGRRPWSNDD